ncbi:single-stranded DNA-binding protein [Flagellimonas sp. CMM7]|uniref:single-stranded DNA-binding protein n=1 Tax=Flagellimonas sp. CMM7 TaxID=2654676 RepID=UPI0013D6AFF9|nr:single-stranded DNA-binding protein [Flagellimonas sp. CMM7]UII80131.1 single-stranded DNA-binding protein [Flagellimonas sp. CMM7]
MSTLRNKVQLIGNVGSEPKITNLESGNKVARFSMATNEFYRNAQGEKVQSTQWHYVVAWDKKADIIEQYVHKGKELAIEGKLISRSYTNEMGVKCYVTEIVANEILLLGSKYETVPTNEIEVVETSVENPDEHGKQDVTENKKPRTGRTSSRKSNAEKAA